MKDDETRQAILDDVLGWLADEGWEVLGLAESPVRGKGGNVEYLAHLKPPGDR